MLTVLFKIHENIKKIADKNRVNERIDIMKYRNQLAALLIVVSVSLLSGCGKSPESIVEDFYHSLANGEISEAKGYVSAQLIGMLGEEKLSAALSNETEAINTCGGIKDIQVKLQGEGEIRFGIATVMYRGTCLPKNEKIKLIKEDGKWKITVNK